VADDEARGGESLLREGERVLLIDRRGRRYLIRLKKGATFQTHAGVLDHDDVIGRHEGSEIPAKRRDEGGSPSRRFLAFRPTLADVVLKMPRGAQVIYPKDLAAILLAADLYPGARVLEAGVGSGALSMTALRAGCVVTGYEIRGDFAEHALTNVHAMFGPDVRFTIEARDIYDGIDGSFDRILLDLPEPWRVVDHAALALAPGGIFLAYLPTINQTSALRERLARAPFALAETIEVLRRSWHVDGRSVRPDHRMVAHTGFITTARRLADGATSWQDADDVGAGDGTEESEAEKGGGD
jgi:tRNA (adenine57-N1/adenine58-N1)-methyltransferase catalytic subunit